MTTPRNARERMILPKVCQPADGPSTDGVRVRFDGALCALGAWDPGFLPRVQSRSFAYASTLPLHPA